MNGNITLISSSRDPVFAYAGERISIRFHEMPKLGQIFNFSSISFGKCHTSTVRAISSEKESYIIQTRNSFYKLEVEPEAKDGK